MQKLKKCKNIKKKQFILCCHAKSLVDILENADLAPTKNIMFMKNGNRKFYRGEVMHIYQRAINGFNIFYGLEDWLVFYTIFSVFVRRFNVTALALCLMIDHFHALLICESKATLSKFIASVTSLYSRLFNETVSRKGRLFDKSFGSAPKVGDKQVRTAIPYVFNNATEKNICSDPEDYMWNFLAYMESDHPFSERTRSKELSKKMKSVLKEVDRSRSEERWLNYVQLSRMYKGLSSKERKQLTDYIVKAYLPFDDQKLLSYYKSIEMMKIAIKSNTGSEYNIREEYNPYSDRLYHEVFRYVQEKISLPPKSLLMLPLDEKIDIANRIAAYTHVPNRQIAKFLHIPIKKGSPSTH